MNKIKIQVSGLCGCGKTTITSLITNVLRKAGFDHIDIVDESHNHNAEVDLVTFLRRTNTLIERGTEISIETINTQTMMNKPFGNFMNGQNET